MSAKWAGTLLPFEEPSIPHCAEGLACASSPAVNEDHIDLIRENCPRCQGAGGYCLMEVIQNEAARSRH